MTPRARRVERREEPLSRDTIVAAAVELLDAAGEDGLTFRALAERLATGAGAIYWHVANKGELLDAATGAIVAEALPATKPARPAKPVGPAKPAEHNGEPGGPSDPGDPGGPAESPQGQIRAVALGLFDAIEEHPWLAVHLATQISRRPWQSVTPRILESIGRQVGALGVPEGSRFTATSALMHYILGAAGQNAANIAAARTLGPGVDRAEFFDTVATAWRGLDPDDYPFTRAVAQEIRDHDDRAQFLDGITLILAGIATVHPPTRDDDDHSMTMSSRNSAL